MQKKMSDVKIIGYGLVVLYATSAMIYWNSYSIREFHDDALKLIFLFTVLLMGAVGIVFFREWGRRIIVLVNAISVVYLLKLYITFGDFIPMSYVFMSIIIALFFNQQKVKARFQARSRKDWQSILLIDDEEALIKTVRPILLSNGYAVLTANTGEDGLQIARTQKPDLILLDVILPGIKGRELCKKIKSDETTKHIPVVFLTSKDSPDDIKAEMEAGAQAHLTKPVDAQSLVLTIKKALRSRPE